MFRGNDFDFYFMDSEGTFKLQEGGGRQLADPDDLNHIFGTGRQLDKTILYMSDLQLKASKSYWEGNPTSINPELLLLFNQYGLLDELEYRYFIGLLNKASLEMANEIIERMTEGEGSI